jgi:hypothetical protein
VANDIAEEEAVAAAKTMAKTTPTKASLKMRKVSP